MRDAEKLHSHVLNEVKGLLSAELEEFQDFYEILKTADEPLSIEFLSRVAPEWNNFHPITHQGRIIAYTLDGNMPEASSNPWVFMPDAPSTAGKTTLVRELAKECQDCIQVLRTCTTKRLPIEDIKSAVPWNISLDPFVMAKQTQQYWHVSESDFTALADSGFFVETRDMWATNTPHGSEARYGIPVRSLQQIQNSFTPVWFLVVDEEGQKRAKQWLSDNYGDRVKVQKWFLVPTGQRFQKLEDRIIFQRGPQAAPRIIDAVKDLWLGGNHADVVFPYPFDKSGIPHEAMSLTREFIGLLSPGIRWEASRSLSDAPSQTKS